MFSINIDKRKLKITTEYHLLTKKDKYNKIENRIITLNESLLSNLFEKYKWKENKIKTSPQISGIPDITDIHIIGNRNIVEYNKIWYKTLVFNDSSMKYFFISLNSKIIDGNININTIAKIYPSLLSLKTK